MIVVYHGTYKYIIYNNRDFNRRALSDQKKEKQSVADPEG